MVSVGTRVALIRHCNRVMMKGQVDAAIERDEGLNACIAAVLGGQRVSGICENGQSDSTCERHSLRRGQEVV